MMKFSKIAGSVLLAGLFFVCAQGQGAQPAAKPEMVGTWTRGYEDFQEFMYHKVERFTLDYLERNPGAKMIGVVCSKERLPAALVSSYGFAYDFAHFGTFFKAPSNRFFLARSSKCANRSEQYWFVPSTGKIESDEIIPAEKVIVRRWITSDYDAASRRAALKDSEAYLNEFIDEMKKNPKAEGFVIRNLKSSNRQFQEAWRRIGRENIEKGRIRVIRKNIYQTYYPEFMTITIQD